MRIQTLLLVLGVCILVSVGCAPVEPWQKGHLAKSHMAFDPDPLDSKFRQHVYQSKEGSSGGYGVAGGGCGCN